MNDSMIYSVAQQSHQGGRDYNEDRTSVFERRGAVLLVLADGLGGHAGGDLASQALVDAMSDSFAKATNEQLKNPESFLTLSINYAHHTIHRRAVSQGFSVDSPKTTCVVCLIVDGIATWAHSGDSRLYLIRKREILYATEDHVSSKAGRLGNSPINRCVGGSEPPKPEISAQHALETGDTLFLASDGAWSSFKPNDLFDYVDPSHPSLGLDNLLQKLEHRNKAPSDNLSIVVLFWEVKQLDHAEDNEEYDEYDEPDTIQLLNASIRASNKDQVENKSKKFDLAELDNAIGEIENFIIDVDDQI